jgi:hypothetical protein
MSSIWVKDERRRIAADEDRGENSLEAAERAELLRLRTQVAEGWVDVPLDLTADRNVDRQGSQNTSALRLPGSAVPTSNR